MDSVSYTHLDVYKRQVEDAMTQTEMRRLMFDVHNLRSMCHDCHVKTHTEMGRSGVKHNKLSLIHIFS